MTHVHVSERHGAKWVLCTETAAVEWQRATWAPVPATWGEACMLRQAEGPGRTCEAGGSSIEQLRVGIRDRWHREPPPRTAGWANLWAALEPGACAVVQGTMGAFPAGSHWRRWQPDFGGYHSAYVERRSADPEVFWCDPLAPAGWTGEMMPMLALRSFVTGWGSARHLVALRISGGPIGGDVVIITDQRPGTVHLAVGSKLRNLDGTPAIDVSVAQDAPSPFATDKGRAVEVTTGGQLQLLLSSGPFTPLPPAADRYDEGRRDEYDAVLAGLGIPPRP